jgi:hypothetical protein
MVMNRMSSATIYKFGLIKPAWWLTPDPWSGLILTPCCVKACLLHY